MVHHGRMGRGGHGLTKASPGPALPNASTPCGRAIPKTALQPFLGWPARRAGGLRSSSTLLDTPRRTPMSMRGIHGLAKVLLRPAMLRVLDPVSDHLLNGLRGVLAMVACKAEGVSLPSHCRLTFPMDSGKFHDQGDAEWIVIRRLFMGS
jgi:hypothetical protein